MNREIMLQIISHLNSKGWMSEDIQLTEDVFMSKLFSDSEDERKEILKAITSSFSEDYKLNLERTHSLDNEIAKKISELGFCSKENQFKFVRGKLSKEEQKIIYNKMFKGLHYVLIGQEHIQTKFSSSLLTENLPVFRRGTELSTNKPKKQSKKKFNLEQAFKNFEVARNTLKDASEFLDQQKASLLLTSQKEMEIRQNEESQFSELSSTVESFKPMMDREVSLPSAECSSESSLPTELGAEVGKLYSHLQHVADSLRSLSSEGTEQKIDFEKMLAQAEEVEKNLATSKCFSKHFIFSDDDNSTYE